VLAVAKKRKYTPRKKKTKIPEKKIGVDELSGFTIGQSIYCFRHPDKILARGEIRILLKTKAGELAEFVDEITGQFRATMLDDIIANPTRSQINSANLKIATKIRKSKENK